MTDWIEELDNQILINRRKVLEGTGKVSHEEAIKKAEKEFQIYREREMKELESNFDLLMKSLPNNDNKKFKAVEFDGLKNEKEGIYYNDNRI